MLLRIIDQAEAQLIELVLDVNGNTEKFTVPFDASPFYPQFRERLAQYFYDYPVQATKQKQVDMQASADLVQQNIKFGQQLGDALIGEDSEIYRWVRDIGNAGYPHLQVIIESSREQFFDEIWEMLILPESSYVLSAVSGGFVRSFGSSSDSDLSAVNYDLNVTSPVHEALNDDTDNQTSSEPEKPLHILHCVARPSGFDWGCDAFDTAVDMLACEGAVAYHIEYISTVSELERYLSQHTVHIVHMDCPIILDDKNTLSHYYFGAGEQGSIPIEGLAKLLTAHKISTLCLNADYYKAVTPDRFECLDANSGLAQVARKSCAQGLGNVLGLSNRLPSWVCHQVYKTLYLHIVEGLNLAQSVVETRKTLQSQIEISRFSPEAKPFHCWQIIQHYGGQPVQYFREKQYTVSLPEAQGYLKRMHDLHGFEYRFFPPHNFSVATPYLFEIKAQMSQGAAQGLIAGSGRGKTHFCHHLGFYLAQSAEVELACYFNYRQDFYSPDLIKEMLAPLLSCAFDNEASINSALASRRIYFVFDNLLCEGQERHEGAAAVAEFIQHLVTLGHQVLATGDLTQDSYKCFSGVVQPLPTLDALKCQILASAFIAPIREEGGEGGETSKPSPSLQLLPHLQENPFLIRQLMPQVSEQNIEGLITQAEKCLQTDDVVNRYFEWQFEQLSPLWQFFLSQSLTVDSLFLEFLMIACDQTQGFAPWQQLQGLFDEQGQTLASGLELFGGLGFLTRMPQGRVLSSDAKVFLSAVPKTENTQATLLFSQVVLSGLAAVSQHIIKEQNPGLSHNVLANRRACVVHFERLWFAGKYTEFTAAKQSFDQLLTQANLVQDGAAWAHDLLTRTDNVIFNTTFDQLLASGTPDSSVVEAQMAWLKLAQSAVQVDAAQSDAKLIAACERWDVWMRAAIAQGVPKVLPLLQVALTFVEQMYIRCQRWDDCLSLMVCVCEYYRQNQAWHYLIHGLMVQATCQAALGVPSEALIAENAIVESIPYEDAPAGFLAQKMADIVVARLHRGDKAHARTLLDQLRKREDAAPLAKALMQLQQELDHKVH